MPLLRRLSPWLHYRILFQQLEFDAARRDQDGANSRSGRTAWFAALIFDSATRRVTGVNVIDAQTRNELEFKARIFFVCASTLESTRILLNSATPEFPNGLANSSGELGHNLMDHHMGAGASGKCLAMKTKCRSAIAPTAFMFRASAT